MKEKLSEVVLITYDRCVLTVKTFYSKLGDNQFSIIMNTFTCPDPVSVDNVYMYNQLYQ